jgi:thiamine-phosphate diphosphorylase
MDLPRPCLCLVTDRHAAAPGARTVQAGLRALQTQLDEAIAAGIDLIQVRERDVDAATLLSFATDLVRRVPAGTRVTVNDRADVALASGAGLHLRSDGPPATRVRPLAGGHPAGTRSLSSSRDSFPGWLIGRSIHAASEAAAAADTDYLIFGTVFPTRSKPDTAPVAGLDGLRAACAATPVPVLAIGGITPGRVADCRRYGAAGVAAIGAFLSQPARVIAAMRAEWVGAALE